MKYDFCTLFDSNYLTRGLALYDSLVSHAGDFHLWILCMDKETYDLLRKMKLQYVTLISLEDFEDKELLRIKSTRAHGEYCWTCTPSLPLYVFKNFPKVKMISYLDSDLYFYSSPEPIFKEIGNNSVMIIPHRFTSNRSEKEKIAGIYNVSMLTFRKDKNGLACLRWWRQKCLGWCFDIHEENRFGDQKYLDEFPSLFEKVHILKNIGANIAPWNIGQHEVTKKIDEKICVNGSPLIFFHFLSLKLYERKWLFPPVSYKGYGGWSTNRILIYNQYLDKIYDQTARVRKYEPDFSKGLVHRGNEAWLELVIDNFLKLTYLLKTI